MLNFSCINAQSNNAILKIWAWEVTSVGGAQIDPSMGVEQPQNVYHLIYLETKNTITFDNITIWVKNGPIYTTKTQKVVNFPVKFNGKDVLISKRKNQVLKCDLNTIDVLLLPEKIKNLFRSNELVIEYVLNKKTYYSVLKKIPKKTEELM